MLSGFDSADPRQRIMVALDCDLETAFDLADTLTGRAVWMKVGMTLFYANGPSVVHALKERGFKVFLDLKFHDIPHQVEGAAFSATQNGADMITMHTAGGIEMMRAAQSGAERAARACGFQTPVTLGITVLTSMDKRTLEEAGVQREITDQVCALAGNAREAGISGVVASPQEARMLRDIMGPDAYIVTPGIRPVGSDKGDQNRIATPAQALRNGASHIVIGRPITQSENPARAFDDIVDSLAE